MCMKLIRVFSCMAAALSLFVFNISYAEKPASSKTTITEISSAEAKKRLADGSGIVVIDVRTPQEFEEGHIEGAKNIDVTADDFEKKLQKLDRRKTYLVHCLSGGRSGRSKAVFKKLGFESILHLTNGFSEWKTEGNKVVK